MRHPNHVLAKNTNNLEEYIEDKTSVLMRDILNKNRRIIIEGTQGFGLSIWQSKYFPFATSRDTTASSFVAESGLAPHDVDDVVLVLRAFPIRVGGNSGPLPNEITWSELAAEANLPPDFEEYSSATHRVRRVARFNHEIVGKLLQAITLIESS